jgi:hypothetical protein
VLLIALAAAVELTSRTMSRLMSEQPATASTIRRKGTPDNYVYNGDFEYGVDEWQAGGASIEAVADGQSGKCLKLRGDGSPAQFAIAWNVARLQPKKMYVLSFWVKSMNSGDERFRVGIWAPKSSTWVSYQDGLSSARWTEYVVTFTNTVSEPISVELMRVMPGNGDLLFDSVQLRPLQPTGE